MVSSDPSFFPTEAYTGWRPTPGRSSADSRGASARRRGVGEEVRGALISFFLLDLQKLNNPLTFFLLLLAPPPRGQRAWHPGRRGGVVAAAQQVAALAAVAAAPGGGERRDGDDVGLLDGVELARLVAHLEPARGVALAVEGQAAAPARGAVAAADAGRCGVGAARLGALVAVVAQRAREADLVARGAGVAGDAAPEKAAASAIAAACASLRTTSGAQ
mgnify:CR=1 FL=1